MPYFGYKSTKELSTAHPDLQKLFNFVVKTYDCMVIQGHRGKEEQDLYNSQGRSKVKYPNSKHNSIPSFAVDVAPYPIDWGEEGTSAERSKAIARFYHFAGYVMATAEKFNIKIRWGGDWDSDLDFSDQRFDDLVHFELVPQE